MNSRLFCRRETFNKLQTYLEWNFHSISLDSSKKQVNVFAVIKYWLTWPLSTEKARGHFPRNGLGPFTMHTYVIATPESFKSPREIQGGNTWHYVQHEIFQPFQQSPVSSHPGTVPKSPNIKFNLLFQSRNPAARMTKVSASGPPSGPLPWRKVNVPKSPLGGVIVAVVVVVVQTKTLTGPPRGKLLPGTTKRGYIFRRPLALYTRNTINHFCWSNGGNRKTWTFRSGQGPLKKKDQNVITLFIVFRRLTSL